MANEMNTKGAITTVIATILTAVHLAGSVTVSIGERFDDAEKIIAEAEKRYGKIVEDS
jgi:FlaG/FlaF family flagellin (archaellin)